MLDASFVRFHQVFEGKTKITFINLNRFYSINLFLSLGKRHESECIQLKSQTVCINIKIHRYICYRAIRAAIVAQREEFIEFTLVCFNVKRSIVRDTDLLINYSKMNEIHSSYWKEFVYFLLFNACVFCNFSCLCFVLEAINWTHFLFVFGIDCVFRMEKQKHL